MDKIIDPLIPLIGDKKQVRIADLGSGPTSRIGNYLKGVYISVCPSDKKYYNEDIEHQDMERLTYPDDFFDIVYCSNALDHTKDALSALTEMIRVCKFGGFVYIECWLDQKQTGYKHYWDAKEDGILTNGDRVIDLKTFGFQIKYIKEYEESRYNRIIATLQK